MLVKLDIGLEINTIIIKNKKNKNKNKFISERKNKI